MKLEVRRHRTTKNMSELKTYSCSESGCEIQIEAVSARAAAQQCAEGGDWGGITTTQWVNVSVTDGSKHQGVIKIAISPEEPECSNEDGHDWQAPHEIVGGIADNPGVWGSGGGVIITEVCMHCGCGKHTDTWTQDPETGEQGLESLTYEVGEFEEQVTSYLREKRRGDTTW